MIKYQENEQLVISTLLKSESKRKKILVYIENPDHYFVVSECRSLFNTIKRLSSGTAKIDIETVNSFCPNVSIEIIKELYDKFSEIDENNIEEHLKLLRTNALEYDLSNKYVLQLTDDLTKDGVAVKDKAEVIQSISEEVTKRLIYESKGFKDAGMLVSEYEQLLEERKQGHTFRTTGDSRIDEFLTYGYIEKEITLVVGRPYQGKSMVCLDNARRLANIGVPAAIFNLEMRNMSSMDRLLSLGTKIDSVKFVKLADQLSKEEDDKIKEELGRMRKEMKIYMDDDPVLSLDSLKYKIGKLQESIKQQYIVVYIDLFTKLMEFGEAFNALDIEKICNKMQRITRELGIHSVLVLQINRSADKEKLKKVDDIEKIYPQFNQIKNSGAFEEVADNIFLICRPSNYLNRFDWGEFVPKYIRLEIGKQRGGSQTTFSNVILYKNPEGYLGLVTPEKDWDPLSPKIDSSQLDGYMH